MKSILTATLLATIFSPQAFAGAANAQIKCVSADGRARLEGDVPGDFADFNLTAEINDKNGPVTVKLHAVVDQTSGQPDESGRISVIEDLRYGVYTLNAEAKDQSQTIRLYALPKSVRYRKHAYSYSATFAGKLSLVRDYKYLFSNVTCTTDYSI